MFRASRNRSFRVGCFLRRLKAFEVGRCSLETESVLPNCKSIFLLPAALTVASRPAASRAIARELSAPSTICAHVCIMPSACPSYPHLDKYGGNVDCTAKLAPPEQDGGYRRGTSARGATARHSSRGPTGRASGRSHRIAERVQPAYLLVPPKDISGSVPGHPSKQRVARSSSKRGQLPNPLSAARADGGIGK